jgi:hypothetical protein
VQSDDPPHPELQRALALVGELRETVRDLRARLEASEAAEGHSEEDEQPESPITAGDMRRALADAQESAFAARRRPGVLQMYEGKGPAND